MVGKHQEALKVFLVGKFRKRCRFALHLDFIWTELFMGLDVEIVNGGTTTGSVIVATFVALRLIRISFALN